MRTMGGRTNRGQGVSDLGKKSRFCFSTFYKNVALY